MKSWLSSLLMLFAVALLTFAGGTPDPESSFGSTAVVQLESDGPNDQVSLDSSPLVVGQPPDSLVVLTSGGELFSEPKFTQPVPPVPVKFTEPAKPKPAPKPVAKAQQANYGSCGPGGCGRRGLFGRRR